MSWLVALGFLKRIGLSVFAWLKSLSFWQLVSLALAAFALLQHFQLADARHDRDSWHRQFTAEHQGRAEDRAAYEKAQKDAAAKNKAEVAQQEAQSQRISDNAKTAYERDLAQLRADNQRLRSKAAPSSPGKPGVSEDGSATKGADGDGVQVSPDDHLQAQEIELRLMYLQNWVKDQLGAQR